MRRLGSSHPCQIKPAVLLNRIAVKRITPDVNRVCMPWKNVPGSIDCSHYDKAYVHMTVFSLSVKVEVISHPDLLRKFIGWYIDAKMVSVVEGINYAVVVSGGSESSPVYIQMGNAIVVHSGRGP